MIEKQFFVENPIKSALFSSLFFCLYLLIALPILAYFFTLSLPVSLLIWGLLGLFALSLLIASFSRRKTIICDSVGCEVRAKNFWERAEAIDNFKWSAVTETEVASISTTDVLRKLIYFDVTFDGQTKRLFKRERYNSSNFNKLIELVNQATPHLPYIWIEGAASLEVLEKAGTFKKVSR